MNMALAPSPDRVTAPPAPRVSVVIPCHNSRATLARAINSVAAQTLRDLEIVVVDDASTDDTADFAEATLAATGLPHVLVRLPQNGGPSVARNAGVAAATGQYVAFLDADDEFLPPKLERQLALFESHPNVTFCCCQALWRDEAAGREWKLFDDLPELLPDGWRLMLWANFVATPCAMARRDDLGIRPFDPALRVGEDRDLWCKLASNGVVAVVREPMVHIHVSSNSFMNRNVTLVQQHTRAMIRKHIRSFADILTPIEKLRIHANLYGEIGRSMIHLQGGYLRGARYLLAAAAMGNKPWRNLSSLVSAAPPMRRLMAVLRGRRRIAGS